MVPEAVKHYVQYHNTDAQGGRPSGGDDRFQIFSSKPLRHLPGHTVWLISGEGTRPKRYFLEYVFEVDEVSSAEANQTGTAWGSRGHRFDPPLPLNDLPWFADFKKSQQNFSLGLREIDAAYLPEFEALTQSQGFHGVTASAYLAALRAVQSSLTPAQIEMLVGHANAPDQCLSMSGIAACGGYKNYEAGNSQYGRLGGMVARALGMTHQLEGVDKTSALALVANDRDELGHWQWRMRPALREALRQLWPDDVLVVPSDQPELQDDAADLRPTERAALIQARVGQGRYRKGLLALWQGRCALTGLDIEPALVASHAKPWRHCDSNAERLDPYNGLLLAASVDRLFDGGLVGFDDEGRLLVKASVSDQQLQTLGVTRGARLRDLDSRHIPYLQAHRRLVFKG